MSYHRDNGSTTTGILFVVFCLLSFSLGYYTRHIGIVLQVNTPAQQEVKSGSTQKP